MTKQLTSHDASGVPFSQHRQPATICREGEIGREPYAELEDGRVMPMGWNMRENYPIGTEGIAEYVSTSTRGLWQFTSFDADAAIQLKSPIKIFLLSS